ncbi:SDR family oxidoreductase [uncultured Sphaerochaeta sp.]|uniref:SDR family NAD(P)-dependent oxidoreductase n=1 Tax=uncultured Sphaerochaeta sp. TaxID=886478 RepID=UPI002A0A66FA|nr:SDR family oxidoreductase [uncultured Sphaerochaeta sp.]
MKPTYSGKTIVIIGGASGIGRECALLFAQHGGNVFIADWNIVEAEKTVEAIQKDGFKAKAEKLDITDSKNVERYFNSFITIDILVNAASVLVLKDAIETTIEEWLRLISINLTGTFIACKYAITAMKKANKGGSIINFSSSTGNYDAAPNSVAYVSSKGGVTLLTKALASDYAKYGIRINAVAPGPTDTAMIRECMSDSELERLQSTLPTRKFGHPRDVANVVLFLASEEASFINGAIIAVDGGQTAKIS